MKSWRKKNNLSQSSAAELIGISQPAYHRYERGEIIPKPKIMARLVVVMGDDFDLTDFYASAVKKTGHETAGTETGEGA